MGFDIRSPDQPIRGREIGGIWVPDSALEQKADRSQSGIVDLSNARYSGILHGAPSAESRFRDHQSYLEAVKTVPWVYACVSLIAYSFAIAPGDLFDEGDEVVEDPTDAFLQVWNKPNPFQSGMVFKELLGMFVELAGEAFITLENQDARGVPGELYLPSPARMRVVQDKKTGEIIGYAYDTSGYQNGRYLPSFIPYAADEVIHIKVANPLNMLRGLGNIEAMETTMDTMVAMSKNELSYWQSGGRITGVLETDQQVDNDTFDRLVNRWRQFSSDKQTRFKTAILEQGLKYTPIAEGFKGLDYSKLDVVKRDFVLANFGVPKNKLGIIEDAQYKSDEADRFFWSETMEPRLTRAEDHLQPLVDVFHPDGDHVWRYERKNYEDDTVKLNNAMVMKSLKSFRLDEIRKYIGVDPIGGKSGNSVILQQTDVVVEIDDLDHADTAAGTAGGGPPSTTAPDDMQRESQAHAAAQNEKDRVAGKRDDLGGTHQGNPGRAGGQAPLPGVSVQGNGNENGRTGAVDGSGHTASSPGANTAPSAKQVEDPEKKWADIIDQLSEEERDELRADYERQLKAAATVRRNFRARGHRVRTKSKSVAGAVQEYAEKAAKVERVPRGGQPAHGFRPATAALITSTALRTRNGLTVKYAAKLREAAAASRRSATPVIAKALKIGDAAERHAYLKENLKFGDIGTVVTDIHTEAANAGWSVGKRSLGFATRATTFRVEEKAKSPKARVTEHVGEHLISKFLDDRYDRALVPNIQNIADRMQDDVSDLIDEGLRRGYSPLQIASGVPDENYDGIVSVFDDKYDAERIARTESMLAYNWGAGNALLDSGATEEEALDGIDDPDCAERNGTVYEIDPETGLAVDTDGNPVVDHPNGTLAFIPTGNLTDLVETGALEVAELGADWDTKGTISIGAEQAARYHKHRNGVMHAHDGGHEAHGHRWSKMPKGLESLDLKGDVGGHEFHGNRWTGGLGARVAMVNHIGQMAEQNHAAMAANLLKTSGGFTYSVIDHKLLNVGDNGFAVSPYKDRERVLDRPVTGADVLDYAKENADLLSHAGHYIGGWKDGGKSYLDVSVVTPNEDEAHAIARDSNQEAIFNFKNGASIPTRRQEAAGVGDIETKLAALRDVGSRLTDLAAKFADAA